MHFRIIINHSMAVVYSRIMGLSGQKYHPTPCSLTITSWHLGSIGEKAQKMSSEQPKMF